MLSPISLLALPLLLASLDQVSAQYGGGSGSDSSSTSTAASASSTGTVHDVDVGNGGLVFSPDSVTAATGDTINFHFYPRNHSVVQSSFDSPCVPLSGGSGTAIFSGFFPVSEGEGESMFSMTVNATDPVWLYCSQGQHCQGGMVMVVNPPTSGDTLDAYKDAAKGVQMTTSPATVAGGIVVANAEASNASMTGSTTGSMTGSATASAASASATGAAAGVRPFAGAVAVGMLAIGLGAWTLL